MSLHAGDVAEGRVRRCAVGILRASRERPRDAGRAGRFARTGATLGQTRRPRAQRAGGSRGGRPKVLVRSVIATREGVARFGPRLIAAAHARGFNAARRKAFVADGSATNWSVHRKYFSHYPAILDFTHAVCYVYAAALAGRSFAEGWPVDCQWAQWLWQGAAEPLIDALQAPAPRSWVRPATMTRKRVPAASSPKRCGTCRTNATACGTPTTADKVCRSPAAPSNRPSSKSIVASRGLKNSGIREPNLCCNSWPTSLSQTTELDGFWKARPQTLQLTRCYQIAT